jgi:hypothetical protein
VFIIDFSTPTLTGNSNEHPIHCLHINSLRNTEERTFWTDLCIMYNHQKGTFRKKISRMEYKQNFVGKE